MKDLKLDELPARIWKECRANVREMLRRAGVKPDGYLIGGGSILAARFGHRRSTDVDLIVVKGVGFRKWTAEDTETANPGRGRQGPAERYFREKMDAKAAWTLPVREFGTVFVFFDMDGKLAELDMEEGAPRIPYGHEKALVNGRAETVLSTAQILAGKLERGEDVPARDAFDFVMTERADPAALEAAANSAGPQRIEDLCRKWRGLNEALREEAQDTVRGVFTKQDCRYGTVDFRNLGSEAARVMEGALYREIAVRTRGDMVEVETATRSGTERRRSRSADESLQLLTEAGIGGHAGGEEGERRQRLGEAAKAAAAAARAGTSTTTARMRQNGEWEWDTGEWERQKTEQQSGTGVRKTQKAAAQQGKKTKGHPQVPLRPHHGDMLKN